MENIERFFEDKTKKNKEKSKKIEKETKSLSMEEVITPEHLQMISRASGGFRFREDPSLPPHQTGYTNKETRVIYYNPLLAKGSPELRIKHWRPLDFRGFAYHESGHHSPEVLSFDEKLIEELEEIEIPEAYKGDPGSEARFVQAIYSHLDNALVDIWLESYMSRRPYYPMREDISEFQKGKGELKTFKMLSKPEQLIQALLRSRYFEQKDLDKKLGADVYEAYEKIMGSRAMETILNRQAFENYFATDLQKESSIERKVLAYQQVFLPEYLKLMEAELEKRKQQRQQQKQGTGGEGVSPMPSEAVPLTKKEEQEIIEQILEELEKAGKEFKPQAPSEDEKQRISKAFKQVEKEIKERHKQIKEGEPIKEKKKKPERKKGLEAIVEEGEEMRRMQKQETQRGLAEAMGVRPEIIEQWEEIKRKYQLEIESTAAVLADVFLDDRRKRLEYLKREGEIVPGLEYETISALLSGELDPDTKMITVRNPEFLETEMEFIVDTSGSMSGEPIEKSIELLVIVTEALKKVKEDLAGENLLMENEEPFKVGVTKFATEPKRVTKLEEPLSDKKQVDIIDELSKVSGGTEETGALKEVYKELTLNKDNVIKIMVVLSDGHGNREGVVPIIQQVEDDDQVVFLAIGLGSEAKAVVETYLEPLKQREKNVFGYEAEEPAKALPEVIEFLKREVNKRRKF